MGLRADTTPQVARIASTRLAAAPRPLRLSYAGQCLRVRGSQLAPDRQIAQAGIELIGPDSPAADAEIVLTGAAALDALGLHAGQFRPHAARACAAACWRMPGSSARPARRWPAGSTARTPPPSPGMAAALAPVLTDLLMAAGAADRALAALAAASAADAGARAGRAAERDGDGHPRPRAGVCA